MHRSLGTRVIDENEMNWRKRALNGSLRVSNVASAREEKEVDGNMRFAVSPRAIYDDMTSSVDHSAKGNEKETRPMPNAVERQQAER